MEQSFTYNVIVAGYAGDVDVRSSRGVGIGAGGSIPWNIPDDLARFKQITIGGNVIMGRKTWESIPERFRPLPKRNNIIVSTTLSSPKQALEKGGVTVVTSLEEAFKVADSSVKTFIIGGESIYTEAITKFPEKLNKLYYSEVHSFDKTIEFDTFFPLQLYLDQGLLEQTRTPSASHDFIVYSRDYE
jgi:dihydrofolate reductase